MLIFTDIFIKIEIKWAWKKQSVQQQNKKGNYKFSQENQLLRKNENGLIFKQAHTASSFNIDTKENLANIDHVQSQ